MLFCLAPLSLLLHEQQLLISLKSSPAPPVPFESLSLPRSKCVCVQQIFPLPSSGSNRLLFRFFPPFLAFIKSLPVFLSNNTLLLLCSVAITLKKIAVVQHCSQMRPCDASVFRVLTCSLNSSAYCFFFSFCVWNQVSSAESDPCTL